MRSPRALQYHGSWREGGISRGESRKRTRRQCRPGSKPGDPQEDRVTTWLRLCWVAREEA